MSTVGCEAANKYTRKMDSLPGYDILRVIAGGKMIRDVLLPALCEMKRDSLSYISSKGDMVFTLFYIKRPAKAKLRRPCTRTGIIRECMCQSGIFNRPSTGIHPMVERIRALLRIKRTFPRGDGHQGRLGHGYEKRLKALRSSRDAQDCTRLAN